MKREQHDAGGEPQRRADALRIAVLVPPKAADSRADQDDTYVQAEEVSACLRDLGHEVFGAEYLDHGPRTSEALGRLAPDLIVNLVEEVPEGSEHLHLTTALLDRLGMRYTGARTSALAALADKRLMKERLRAAGLPVAPGLGDSGPEQRFIVKSVFEHASLGIDHSSIVTGANAALGLIAERERTFGGTWFAEAYIHGREFDVSLIEENGQLRTLPVAEVEFWGAELGGLHLFDYLAKWDPTHARTVGVQRYFPEREEPLFGELERIAMAAWHAFALNGVAHVDIRVDEAGRPFVLDVNANPTLRAKVGICEAAEVVGLTQADIVARLVAAA